MGNFTGFQKSDDFYLHPRLGQIKRIQSQHGPQLIQHKVKVDSDDILYDWIDNLSQISGTSVSSLLFLPKSHFHQRLTYCGQQSQVFLLFEDYMFCLKDEIQNRKMINRYFSQSSVWEILLRLVQASSQLEKLKLKVGNINPQNILINQDGQFRILSSLSWPMDSKHTFSDIQFQEKFYSPEELQKLQRILHKRPKPEISDRKINRKSCQTNQDQTLLTLSSEEDVEKEEIFSIGATLLEICTLEESRDIYCSMQEKLDLGNIIYACGNQIGRKLALMQLRYSQSLIRIIGSMLKIRQQDRISASQILEILIEHEPRIAKHNFFPTSSNYRELTTSYLQQSDKIQKNLQEDQRKAKHLQFACCVEEN